MRSRPTTRPLNVLMGKLIMSNTAARSRAAALGAVLAASAMTAGCRTDGEVTASIYPADYRVRHPIALTYAPNTLDLFISRNMTGLDARQAEDLRAFAAEYRRSGRGPMTVLVPVEPNAPAASRRGADAVRSALAAAGVSRAYLQVQSYPGPGNSLASRSGWSSASCRRKSPPSAASSAPTSAERGARSRAGRTGITTISAAPARPPWPTRSPIRSTCNARASRSAPTSSSA